MRYRIFGIPGALIATLGMAVSAQAGEYDSLQAQHQSLLQAQHVARCELQAQLVQGIGDAAMAKAVRLGVMNPQQARKAITNARREPGCTAEPVS